MNRTIYIDVKDNAYINIDKEVNNKDPKLKVGDHVRISKYKNIIAKGQTPNCSEEIFVIREIKNTVLWNSRIMTEFVGVTPKSYSILIDDF